MQKYSPFRQSTQPQHHSQSGSKVSGEVLSSTENRYFQEEISRLKQQLKSAEQNYSNALYQNEQALQLERKVSNLISENKAVNAYLAERMNEYDKLRKQNADLVVELNRLRGLEIELNLTKELSDIRQKETDKQRARNNQVEADIKMSKQQLTEAQNKNKALEQEVQQWKQRFTELDQERIRQLEQTRYTLETLREQEIQHLQGGYDDQIRQLEQNVEILAVEYEKLVNNHKSKTEELDQYKIKYSKLEVKYNNEISRLEHEFSKIRSQQDRNQESNLKQTQLEQYLAENQRLANQLQVRNDEIDNFRKLLEQTAQQISLFQERNKELSKDNKKLKRENERLIAELDTIQGAKAPQQGQ